MMNELEERRENFELSLGHHGFIEDGMMCTIEKMHEIFSIFFGEDVADWAFLQIMSHGLRQKPEENETWREFLDRHASSLFFETSGGVLLFHLAAYAEQGIVIAAARDAQKREEMLRRWVEDGQRLLEILPLKQWNLDGEYLVRTVNKAAARWKIDNAQPINAEELALLSGRALQTIRNNLAHQSGIKGNQARIEALDAAAWLAGQKDFKASIWRDQDESHDGNAPYPEPLEFEFVPVAADGTIFHRGLSRNGKYLIDEEGTEQEIEDFDEALAELQKMFVPQWRRPSPEGRWTRVRGVDWRRVPKTQVRTDPDHKHT